MLTGIVGTLLIAVGIAWAMIAMMAAGMASRPTTAFEQFGPASLGLIPILLGLALIFA